MDVFWQDLKHAWRLAWRSRTLSATIVLTLTLGIGASSALFTVVYGVLLRPLPYPTGDRLVRLAERHRGRTPIAGGSLISQLTYHAWQERLEALEGIAGFQSRSHTVTGRGVAVRVEGAAATPSLFTVLGVAPVAGRPLLPTDAAEGAEPVTVLSYGLWQEWFGGAPSAIGRTIEFDGQPHTVVGVMPREFYFPGREARFWTVFRVPPLPAPGEHSMSVFAAVGLLGPERSIAQASFEGTAAARAFEPRPPVADLFFGGSGPVEVRVHPLVDEIAGETKPALLVLAAGVTLVLLVACANVASLLLSRGFAREHEFAVRAAIGAGRRRLACQLLTETLLLSFVGGLLGIAVCTVLTRLLPIVAHEQFPRLADVRFDALALTFAIGISLVCGLLAGMLPAVRSAGLTLSGLGRGSRTTRRASGRAGTGLLATEAALAVVLLVGALLLGRSFLSLTRVDAGYDPSGVLAARLHFPPATEDPARVEAFLNAVLERLRATPGVRAAGAGNMAPFLPMTAITSFTLPPSGRLAEPRPVRARSYVVTPGYAEALGLRLLDGRLLGDADRAAGVHAVLVNDELLRAYLDDGDPVAGRRIDGVLRDGSVMEIAGVVGNVLKDGLDGDPQPEIYHLPRDGYSIVSEASVLVRTSGDPLEIVPALRTIVSDTDPAAALSNVTPLDRQVSSSLGRHRFAAVVLSLFATIALVLAAVGLYGVLAHQIAERERELGVRIALGASTGRIVGLILRQGLLVSLAGVMAGVGASLLGGRLIEGLLFGIEPADPASYVVAVGVLTAVAVAACLGPALRAAGTDPVAALRSE